MIVGVGIDLVELDRIANSMKNPRFLRRILTEQEVRYCNTVSRVAGRWAAKEAIAKAVARKLSWQDVEVLPNANGEPQVKVREGLLPKNATLRVSITHERTHAASVAILEIVSR